MSSQSNLKLLSSKSMDNAEVLATMDLLSARMAPNATSKRMETTTPNACRQSRKHTDNAVEDTTQVLQHVSKALDAALFDLAIRNASPSTDVVQIASLAQRLWRLLRTKA